MTDERPLRIAFVGDWFLPRLGGIELQMRDLALKLMERGHQVEVICGVPGPDSQDRIPIRRVPGPRLPGAGIAVTPGVFRALRATIAERRYDVVHVHAGIIAPIAHRAIQIAIDSRLPAVATFHSVLAYYDVPMRLLDRIFGYGASHVGFAAVSTVAAEAMRPLTGGAPIAVIANGIDLEAWRPAREAVRPPAPPVEFVSVSRLEPRKRPRHLVEAFARAVAGLPPGSARLTLVGDGGERPAIERRIERLGLAEAVVLAGSLPREAIRDILGRSHVFALASKYESFGIAALEGLSSGLPVVTMAMSGARDFLQHGANALLAQDDDDFAAQLRSLIVDPELRARLAEGAAARPDGVDWADVVPRYEAEYRAAIARVGSRLAGR